MLEQAIQMKLTVLERMKYYFKTAFGTSSEYFQNTFLRMILGMLQGSAEVCPIWSLSSSVQFAVLDEQFEPTVFPSPRPDISTQRNGEGFVDYVALWETSDTEPVQELVESMEENAQAWERSGFVNGGALNLLKTFFYAIGWKYHKNGQPVMRSIADDPELTISLTQGADRERTTNIKRIEVTEGKRTLRVRLAPIGKDQTEFQHRLKDAVTLRSRILRAPLGKESTRRGFQSMILQKFKYPLGATCFSETECDKIQGKFLPTVLSKMGLNRSTHVSVRAGPSLYAGMEVSSLQGTSKNKIIVGHLRKEDMVGDNLFVELDCLQLQSGVLWNVLSREGEMVRKYIDDCWAKHLWEFNDRYGITLQREEKAWLLPQREHDQFIMEALTSLPAATTARLKGAQCCCLFLQVTTLADITNSSGTKLADWVTNPRYAPPSQRQAILQYPNQGKPNSTTWNDFVNDLVPNSLKQSTMLMTILHSRPLEQILIWLRTWPRPK